MGNIGIYWRCLSVNLEYAMLFALIGLYMRTFLQAGQELQERFVSAAQDQGRTGSRTSG